MQDFDEIFDADVSLLLGEPVLPRHQLLLDAQFGTESLFLGLVLLDAPPATHNISAGEIPKETEASGWDRPVSPYVARDTFFTRSARSSDATFLARAPLQLQ